MHEATAIGLGLAAGVLAGMFGVGGRILFVPALTLVLGLEQIHAEASSLLAIIPTVMVASWVQHRHGNVRWRTAVVLGFAGVAGVVGGGFLAESTPEHVLRRLFAGAVLLMAAHTVWRVRRYRPSRLAPPAADSRP